jgi:hypothetical protein
MLKGDLGAAAADGVGNGAVVPDTVSAAGAGACSATSWWR